MNPRQNPFRLLFPVRNSRNAPFPVVVPVKERVALSK